MNLRSYFNQNNGLFNSTVSREDGSFGEKLSWQPCSCGEKLSWQPCSCGSCSSFVEDEQDPLHSSNNWNIRAQMYPAHLSANDVSSFDPSESVVCACGVVCNWSIFMIGLDIHVLLSSTSSYIQNEGWYFKTFKVVRGSGSDPRENGWEGGWRQTSSI